MCAFFINITVYWYYFSYHLLNTCLCVLQYLLTPWDRKQGKKSNLHCRRTAGIEKTFLSGNLTILLWKAPLGLVWQISTTSAPAGYKDRSIDCVNAGAYHCSSPNPVVLHILFQRTMKVYGGIWNKKCPWSQYLWGGNELLTWLFLICIKHTPKCFPM